MQFIDNSFNLKTEIIKAHVKANMMDILALEPYEILIKPNFETACWYYDFIKNTNKIYIGDGIFERTTEGFTDKPKIILSYLIHEAAHSIFTTKNLVGLSTKLKEKGLNFSLYNLFEDARIEQKIRDAFGYSFNWSSFEEVPEDSLEEKPTTTLFKIIQTEDTYAFDVPYYEKVKKYYNKIINAKEENELINIMLEWKEDFPSDTKPEHNKNMAQNPSSGNENEENEEQGNDNDNSSKDEKGEKNKSKENKNSQAENEENENDEVSDLELAAQLQEDPDLASEFDEDTKVAVGDAKAALDELEQELLGEQEVKYLEPVEARNEMLLSSTTTEIFKDNSFDETKIFSDKLNKAEERLRRILKSKDIETINSTSHDNKFNIKGVVQALSGHPNAKPYKKNIEEDYEETKKKVFILMDGSASMNGLPQKNMLTFCTVANRLSNINLFEGWIGASKINSKLQPITQAFQLPVDDGIITSFVANGKQEGLGSAIKVHKEQMKEADYVFILTDAQINDEDLAFLKYEETDIYEKTVGIYMGKRKNSNIKDMDKWFGKSIIEDKFEDVIEKIVTFLDPTSNKNQNLEELEIKNQKELETFEQILNLNRI